MHIDYLSFTSFGPFDEIEFNFDQQVNVLVGPNNSGKSAALMVLSHLIVHPFSLPLKFLRKEKGNFEIKFSRGKYKGSGSGPFPIPDREREVENYIALLEKLGFTTYVPALRQSTDFRAEGPGLRKKDMKAWTHFLNDTIHPDPYIRSTSSDVVAGTTKVPYETWIATPKSDETIAPELLKRRSLISSKALITKDSAVIQKIIDLDYQAYRQNNKAIKTVIESIATIASEITEGFPVNFVGIEEDSKGLFPVFSTPDGRLPLNCLSQGTQSIMQWLSHLILGYAEYYNYPKDLKGKSGILIIDEIDAHLHPSWQQRIIPTLIKYFPNLQIFFSTHSPLMLAGLSSGQIQLLKRGKSGEIFVSRNETDIKGWSADEILRGLQDIKAPTDLETLKNVDRLQKLRSKKRLSKVEKSELQKLRNKISEDLIKGAHADQIERMISLIRNKGKNK